MDFILINEADEERFDGENKWTLTPKILGKGEFFLSRLQAGSENMKILRQ